MELAISKARAHDVGVVCVVNSMHFGAAGYYAEMAAEADLIGMVTTSTRGISLVPTHGTEAVLGTNPFAFAAPAGRHPPLVLDFATTVAAVNKVRVHARRGLPLPDGWVMDGSGNHITDAMQALDIFARRESGGLNPVGGDSKTLGGHKGYGLALFSHILGGALPGSSFSPTRVKRQAPNEPDKIGHFFLALNPEAFRPFDDYQRDVDEVIDTLKAVPPADPGKPVLVAGEPEHEIRAERSANGIPMDAALRDQVRQIAETAGVPYLLG
jgi:LDH2 family malate/lactate/ureidoglycolate dehydrogenase